MPAVEMAVPLEFEQGTGDGRADDPCNGGGGHELGDGAGALVGGEPEGEIEDHAGEETGFSDAEQETHKGEAGPAADEHHRRSDEAPGDHDAGDPMPWTESGKGEVAGQVKGRGAQEEEAGAEAVDGVSEVQVVLHFERGEADVDAVEVRKNVEEEDVRDQAPTDLGIDLAGVDLRYGFGGHLEWDAWDGRAMGKVVDLQFQWKAGLRLLAMRLG